MHMPKPIDTGPKSVFIKSIMSSHFASLCLDIQNVTQHIIVTCVKHMYVRQAKFVDKVITICLVALMKTKCYQLQLGEVRKAHNHYSNLTGLSRVWDF